MNEDFYYKKPEFSFQEISHLSLIESSLEKICKEFGFKLEEEEGTPVRGRRNWQRGFEFDFKGDYNHLFFNVSYDDGKPGPIYWIAGGGYFPDSVFLNLRGVDTDNLNEAVKAFSELVKSARNQNVPEEYLKPRNVWKRVSPPLPVKPASLENHELVWFRNYLQFRFLDQEFHQLEVTSDFDYGFNLEKTRVVYQGPEITESLEIKNGRIVETSNSYSDREKSRLRKKLGIVIPNIKEDFEGWWKFIHGDDVPTPKTKHFRQIKSFEDKLRELPNEMQPDLKAIYKTTGFVGKSWFLINGIYSLRDFIRED